MSEGHTISLILHAHIPFVRHPEYPSFYKEQRFFDALSNTFLPLLEMFDRLDAEHIRFNMALSLSPTLCHMLKDELLLSRYLEYTSRQIDFGLKEIERTASDPEMNRAARFIYDRTVERRILFTERYEQDILNIFNYYQKKGRLELLTTSATHAFLPFYTRYPEAVQAQLEVAGLTHRQYFGRNPQGIWLPEMGWSPELDAFLRAYNFGFTILEPHALMLGKPPAVWGNFFPLKTPSGTLILGRDFNSRRELLDDEEGFIHDPVYLDNKSDAGYELPKEDLLPFIEPDNKRTGTGYKYYSQSAEGDTRTIYDPDKAGEKVRFHAGLFLDSRAAQLAEAAKLIGEAPVSVCAFEAELFGVQWREGIDFIEALFREGAKRRDIQFRKPGEYLYKKDSALYQTMMPGFSSSGNNGYGETWLDASNDWMYRHVFRSIERMVELAERFPDDTGLKERALNQAAREMLLVQCTDWPGMLYRRDDAEYARNQIEICLRNFTTIYESLGSNYISTEWLTNLERRHNIFPFINYRVFRRKQ